jgi:indolepyruvate ferredoxin oxidoreductase alpha subunit
LLDEEGSHHLLMGNEAVARGAIEAGVHVAVGYPGTPSTEVIETLAQVAEQTGMRVEWAVNEKVAFDIATGVAYGGARCICTMKSAGVNVASDSIVSVAYSDLVAGLVIYVADDPGLHSGMEEQDSRIFAAASLLPMLDVSDSQDSKDTVVQAFEYSERQRVPVIVRSTARVAHGKSPVIFGPVKKVGVKPHLCRDISVYTRASPVWCQQQHSKLIEKTESLLPDFERRHSRLNMRPEHRVGVIASGVSWNYLLDVIADNRLDLATLKVGSANPLPLNHIRRLVSQVDRVLVLEELEPYIEVQVKAVIADLQRRVVVYGKQDGTLPRVGEYDYDLVEQAVNKLLGKAPELDTQLAQLRRDAVNLAPRRSLPFCPGCPHRGTYTALNQALKELGYGEGEAIVTGDIGCTILGMHPPFNSCWMEVSMGASVGLAIGLKYAGVEAPVIATIGDSTFFHAGMPPALNAAWNKTGIVVAVLDNEITGMTGHQPSPSTGLNALMRPVDPVRAERILEASGFKNVAVVSPFDLEESKEAFKEAIQSEGPSAVVLRGKCALVARRQGLIGPPSRVDPERCVGCLICVRTLSCPAMSVVDGKMVVDESTCMGCGLCSQVCPAKAIGPGGDA